MSTSCDEGPEMDAYLEYCDLETAVEETTTTKKRKTSKEPKAPKAAKAIPENVIDLLPCIEATIDALLASDLDWHAMTQELADSIAQATKEIPAVDQIITKRRQSYILFCCATRNLLQDALRQAVSEDTKIPPTTISWALGAFWRRIDDAHRLLFTELATADVTRADTQTLCYEQTHGVPPPGKPKKRKNASIRGGKVFVDSEQDNNDAEEKEVKPPKKRKRAALRPPTNDDGGNDNDDGEIDEEGGGVAPEESEPPKKRKQPMSTDNGNDEDSIIEHPSSRVQKPNKTPKTVPVNASLASGTNKNNAALTSGTNKNNAARPATDKTTMESKKPATTTDSPKAQQPQSKIASKPNGEIRKATQNNAKPAVPKTKSKIAAV